MPITLNDFRALSNGEYNAGQIDFKTNGQGEVTGLKKVNNFVHRTGKNKVAIDAKRAVEIKETFIKALAAGGVTQENIAKIRAKLGIATETKTSVADAGAALQKRITPLTRQQVREILRNDAGLDQPPGTAPAESRSVREKRTRVNQQAEALVRKSPPHEQLFSLLAGKSSRESAMSAMRSSPDMMKVAAGLRANRMDTAFQNAWNRGIDTCLNRQGRTLAMLRAAVSAFAADPAAGPQEVKTPFGTITLTSVAEEAMNATHLEASIKVGNETLTLDLGGTPGEIAAQLDKQIADDAQLLGKERLGAMLSYAKRHGAVAEDSDPCLGRTVAQAILRTFANVGQELLDELDNHSLSRYARDVVNGTGDWTEDSIRTARNEALRDADNVKVMAEVAGEIKANDGEGDKIVKLIADNANEGANEDANEVGNDGQVPGEVPPQEPEQGLQLPEEQPQPQPQPLPQPPAKDTFEKIVGSPLPKDANDILPGRKATVGLNPVDDKAASVPSGDGEVPAHFKKTIDQAEQRAQRRAEEKRIFDDIMLKFVRPEDVNKPVDDKFSSVKPGSLKEPEHFRATRKIENFTFAAANLPQAERKAIGDFALGLVNGAVTGDKAALKALVAQNLHALFLMAADPDGASAFFPPELLVADAKGLVASLAGELKAAAKAGTGRDVDFRSFTQGDEDAVKTMLGREKHPEAANALAAKVTTILRESVSVAARKPSAEAMTAAGAALGGTSADALAALARKNPLELIAFAAGNEKISGRNAAQTAEIKAAVMKAFTEATGKATLAEMTLAEFDAFAAKCANGALDKALGAIASRNALFGGDLYNAVGGNTAKRVAADVATKDLGAVPKAPQTAELTKGDAVGGIQANIVGGVTLHIPDMLDSDAPHPRNATAADLRDLAADLLEAAEGIFAKGANASPEAIRAVMLKDIDAFCRFLDNPRALGEAVMPQLRELVAGAMADVRKAMDEALQAALGKDLRATRPVEIKQFVKDKMDAAALGKVAAAFATLAEKSAVQMQTFVNGVCNLDPNAKIVSEYDKMKPEQITKELASKSLDSIIEDPLTNPTRPGMLAFQKKVLSTYFTAVSRERKAGVLASALRNAPETAEAGSVATKTKFLSAILLGAGPLMQKTLQGIDRRVAGAYGEAFGVLKSSIPPIPDAHILSKLNEIVKNNPDKYQLLVPVDGNTFVPLGAATVGQAVKCSFMTTAGQIEEVIVKIMRPGVKERFDEDVKIFDAVAREIPSVRKVWDARVKTIADEFDFRVEARNIEIGQVYEVYDHRHVMVMDKKSGKMVPKEDPKTHRLVRTPGTENTWTVSAMKTPAGVKQTSDVLVGSIAPGRPFDKVLGAQTRAIHALFAGVFETDANGSIRRVDGKPVVRKDMSLAGFLAIRNGIRGAVSNISESSLYFRQVIWKWLEEALFKSGVMHNDVHTGNLMLDTEEQRATYIDFGNVVRLSKNERLSLLKMVAAVAAKHSDFFIAAFEELLGKGTPEQKAFSAQRDKVHAAVSAVIHKGKTKDDTGYRFQALLSEMQKLGVDIPPQVASFVEGLTRLQNCYEELSDLLAEAKSLYQAYVEQVVNGDPKLAPREDDDFVGQLLDIMVKPGALDVIKELDPTEEGIGRDYYFARDKVMDQAWQGMDDTIKGSLITQMDEAIEAEKDLPGNEKLSHLVSLVSRHAFPNDAAALDAALANFADVKRRLRGAEASGATGRADELRKELADAQNTLRKAVVDGLGHIQIAVDDAKEALPPREREFVTETAADIFADIVNANFDTVKKSFTGLFGTTKLGIAFAKALKDDVNHKTDGHLKTNANKL